MKENCSQYFFQIGEPFAAGFFQNPERSRFYRLSVAYAEYLKCVSLEPYHGGNFYPCTPINSGDYAVKPSISLTYDISFDALKQKDSNCADVLFSEAALLHRENNVHSVAGWVWTHSMPNYARIASEGLNSYQKRVNAQQNSDFKEGLSILLDGIDCYRKRCVSFLRENNAVPVLIAALEKVPFEPSTTIYEAMVCRIFLYCLDCCDNFGRIDRDLFPYYKGETVEPFLHELFQIVDATEGFSAAIGPEYNPITLQCIKAIKGLRRPSLELRITPEMPQELWDAALDSLASGCTNPCLYNENGYYKSFQTIFPDLPYEDYLNWCGAGCTETSIAGMSNVGSLDAGMNLPYLFTNCMRLHMNECHLFSEFYQKFFALYAVAWKETSDLLNVAYKSRAQYRPNPMRTLLTDDCIDKGLDFNNGGAKYHWSIINFAGIVNVVDSMLAVKGLVFEKKIYTPERFLALLDEQNSEFLNDCKKCHCFGVNDETADAFATQFTNDLFDELEPYRTALGGKFLPASIQFSTCASAGKGIPATPDGRANGAPLADSIAAIHGKDNQGLTSMLNSAASFNQSRMLGTPVLNLKIGKAYLKGAFKGLVLGYFAQGGMQIQVNAISKEEMQKAQIEPEQYGNLIVRVGGYSEYFTRLPKDLQDQIIARTEFASR